MCLAEGGFGIADIPQKPGGHNRYLLKSSQFDSGAFAPHSPTQNLNLVAKQAHLSVSADATIHERVICHWWTQWLDATVCILTSSESGFYRCYCLRAGIFMLLVCDPVRDRLPKTSLADARSCRRHSKIQKTETELGITNSKSLKSDLKTTTGGKRIRFRFSVFVSGQGSDVRKQAHGTDVDVSAGMNNGLTHMRTQYAVRKRRSL